MSTRKSTTATKAAPAKATAEKATPAKKAAAPKVTKKMLVEGATEAQVAAAKKLLVWVPDVNHKHHAGQKARSLHLEVCNHNFASVKATEEQLTKFRAKEALCKTCLFAATLQVVSEARTTAAA